MLYDSSERKNKSTFYLSANRKELVDKKEGTVPGISINSYGNLIISENFWNLKEHIKDNDSFLKKFEKMFTSKGNGKFYFSIGSDIEEYDKIRKEVFYYSDNENRNNSNKAFENYLSHMKAEKSKEEMVNNGYVGKSVRKDVMIGKLEKRNIKQYETKKLVDELNNRIDSDGEIKDKESFKDFLKNRLIKGKSNFKNAKENFNNVKFFNKDEYTKLKKEYMHSSIFNY